MRAKLFIILFEFPSESKLIPNGSVSKLMKRKKKWSDKRISKSDKYILFNVRNE